MAFENVVMDVVEVSLTHLKLMGTGGEKVSSEEQLAKVRDKESGKHEIKRKDRFDTISDVERGVTSGFANSCTVSPKDKGHQRWPF